MQKVSVIIPVYNAQQYLRQCLDSVCGQTLQEIEIICVDDGSSDDSYNILKEYKKRDDRIQIYRQKNQYAGVARNNGMKHAGGKYVIFLDADDYFDAKMLEKMYHYAEKNHTEVAICQFRKYWENVQTVELVDFSEQIKLLPRHQEVFSGSDLQNAGIFQLTQGWAWDKLFLREYVEHCGYEFPAMRSSEDGFFSFLLLARAERMGYIQEHLLTYRVGNAMSLSETKDANWENGFIMLDMIYQELMRLDLYDLYQKSFLQFVINFEMWYLRSMKTRESFQRCFSRIVNDEQKYKIRMLAKKGVEFSYIGVYEKVLENSLEDYLFLTYKDLIRGNERNAYYMRNGQKGWLLPFSKLSINKNILLYGAGSVGQDYYRQLTDSHYAQSVIWADKSFEKYQKEGLDVVNPEAIDFSKVDYAVIAILKENIVAEVKNWLIQKGIPELKIIS